MVKRRVGSGGRGGGGERVTELSEGTDISRIFRLRILIYL